MEPVIPRSERADQGGRSRPGGQHGGVLDGAALPFPQQERLGGLRARDDGRAQGQGCAVGPAGPGNVEPGDGGLHLAVVVVGQGVAGHEHCADQRQRGGGPQHGAVGDRGQHPGGQRPGRARGDCGPVPRQRAEPVGLAVVAGQQDAVQHQAGRRARGKHDPAHGEVGHVGGAGHHRQSGRGQQSAQHQQHPRGQGVAEPGHGQRGGDRGCADQGGLTDHRADHAQALGDLPPAEQQHRQRRRQRRPLDGDRHQQPRIPRRSPPLVGAVGAGAGGGCAHGAGGQAGRGRQARRFIRRSRPGRRSAPCTRSRGRT